MSNSIQSQLMGIISGIGTVGGQIYAREQREINKQEQQEQREADIQAEEEKYQRRRQDKMEDFQKRQDMILKTRNASGMTANNYARYQARMLQVQKQIQQNSKDQKEAVKQGKETIKSPEQKTQEHISELAQADKNYKEIENKHKAIINNKEA